MKQINPRSNAHQINTVSPGYILHTVAEEASIRPDTHYLSEHYTVRLILLTVPEEDNTKWTNEYKTRYTLFKWTLYC